MKEGRKTSKGKTFGKKRNKFNQSEKDEIWNRFKTGDVFIGQLADEFNTNHVTISRIISEYLTPEKYGTN